MEFLRYHQQQTVVFIVYMLCIQILNLAFQIVHGSSWDLFCSDSGDKCEDNNDNITEASQSSMGRLVRLGTV